MGIGDQFSGLDMKNLIGAPLSATADASIQLAQSTADFINTVGFDNDGKVRTANFKFNKMEHDPDGNLTNQEMSLDVPLLSIVPIPNLQVDEVNVLFDMEVKQSEQSENSKDYGGSFSTQGSIFGFKVSVSGSVSAHNSNTRSSDNSAKYHVDVCAKNHGTPEGLSRVLDIMASNVAPSLVSSTAVDQNGVALTGDKKIKNDKLKELTAKQFQLDTAVTAAKNYFNNSIITLKRTISNTQNEYILSLQKLINSSSPPTPSTGSLTDNLQIVTENWNNFQNQAKDIVVLASDAPTPPSLSDLIKLPYVKDVVKGDLDILDSATIPKLLQTSYENAISANVSLNKSIDASTQNSDEYNKALAII